LKGKLEMKAKILLLVGIVLVFLSGCAQLRETTINISEEDIKNVEMAREVAGNYLKTWQLQSGFIRGSLGDRVNELPANVVSAMDELDQLAEQYQAGDPNDFTDYNLGLSLGLRVRMLSSIVAEALKFYMPEALDFVPLVF